MCNNPFYQDISGFKTFKPQEGFGGNPLNNGNWWMLTDKMKDRAEKFDLLEEFDTLGRFLFDSEFQKTEDKGESLSELIKIKRAEKIVNYDSKTLDEKRDAIASWLIRKGKKSKKERYVLTDEHGAILHISKGKEKNIELTDRAMELLSQKPKQSAVLYHNYPSGMSFSKEDICVLLSNHEINEIVAVGHNHMIYSLKIGRGKRLTKGIFFKETEDIYNKYDGKSDTALKIIAKKYNWIYTSYKGSFWV